MFVKDAISFKSELFCGIVQFSTTAVLINQQEVSSCIILSLMFHQEWSTAQAIPTSDSELEWTKMNIIYSYMSVSLLLSFLPCKGECYF